MKSTSVFWLITSLFFLSTVELQAQQHPQAHCDSLRSDTSVHCVKEIFSHGSFHGHARHFFMSTIHPGQLNDYWANAVGGAAGYTSARVYGFGMALKGQFSYNVWSNELTEIDEETGGHSSYELQLFDLEHPHNRNDLDRLEELYIDYLTDFGYYKFGKMDITTPLVNPQDGRMKPYVLHGFWSKTRVIDDLVFSFGLFDKFSPRSTTHWYDAEHSIGIYGQGVAVNGVKNNYRGNTETKGLAITGLQFHTESFRAQAWNYYIQNISNTFFTQFNYHSQDLKRQWRLGLQFLTQFQVGEGGNNDSLHLQYFSENDRPMILAAKVAHNFGGVTLSLNGLHAFGEGRFIFPKEWGREQFFTTLSRGRVEGAGKMTVLMAKSNIKPKRNEHLQVNLEGGYFFMPSVNSYALNKYSTPSHFQFNTDIKYSFSHLLDGMEVRLLYVLKSTPNVGAFESSTVFNRSHFHQINLVTNIHF